jgi:hypothetical protein
MGVGVIAAAEQECHARHAVERLQGVRKTLPQMNDATGDHVGKVVEIVEVLARDDWAWPGRIGQMSISPITSASS